MEVKVLITAGAEEKDFTEAAAKIGPNIANMLAGHSESMVPLKNIEAGPAITILGQICLALMDINQISTEKISLENPRIEATIKNYITTCSWTECWCIECAGTWIAAMAGFTIALLKEIHGDNAAAAWESLISGMLPAVRMLGARSIPAR